MIEREPSPEVMATAEQAQAVVDEVARITQNDRLLPAVNRLKNPIGPCREHPMDDAMFIHFPEGTTHPDDPAVIRLAYARLHLEDGSRLEYSSEITEDGNLQLTKHVDLPQKDESSDAYVVMQKVLTLYDIMNNFDEHKEALEDVVRKSETDHEARAQERTFGMHFATSADAYELLAVLQLINRA